MGLPHETPPVLDRASQHDGAPRVAAGDHHDRAGLRQGLWLQAVGVGEESVDFQRRWWGVPTRSKLWTDQIIEQAPTKMSEDDHLYPEQAAKMHPHIMSRHGHTAAVRWPSLVTVGAEKERLAKRNRCAAADEEEEEEEEEEDDDDDACVATTEPSREAENTVTRQPSVVEDSSKLHRRRGINAFASMSKAPSQAPPQVAPSAADTWTKGSAAGQAEPVSATMSPGSGQGAASVVDGGIGDSASVADYVLHDEEKQEDGKDGNGVPIWEAAVKKTHPKFDRDEDLEWFHMW